MVGRCLLFFPSSLATVLCILNPLVEVCSGSCSQSHGVSKERSGERERKEEESARGRWLMSAQPGGPPVGVGVAQAEHASEISGLPTSIEG